MIGKIWSHDRQRFLENLPAVTGGLAATTVALGTAGTAIATTMTIAIAIATVFLSVACNGRRNRNILYDMYNLSLLSIHSNIGFRRLAATTVAITSPGAAGTTMALTIAITTIALRSPCNHCGGRRILNHMHT